MKRGILTLFLAMLLLGAAQGLSVSMSSDAGSIRADMSGKDDSRISGSMLVAEGGIVSRVGGSGDVTIGQSASGGRQSVRYAAQTVGGGDISSEIGAAEGGVFGRLDYEGSEALSYGEVDTLARNPDLELQKNTLTKNGKVLIINGGTTDITAKWHIDPDSTFRIGVLGQDLQMWNGETISRETLKNSIKTGMDFINAATGLPIVDGVYETNSVSWGRMDGKNTVMWDDISPKYVGVTSTYYNSRSRRVVESDTLLNAHYHPNYVPTNPSAQANLNRVEIHEMFHMAGMADITTDNYGSYLAGNTIMGAAKAPSWLDEITLWYKYNK